jgi:hypothetical protein
MSTLPPAHRDPFAAVSRSFADGWRRVTYLFFEAPGSRVRNWFAWGLIVLLAGVTYNGPSNPGGGRGWKEKTFDMPGQLSHWTLGPGMVALVVAAIIAAVIVGLVLLYIASRFQLVLLEGVIAGEPRIRGVFRKTGGPGLSYFVLRLVVAFVSLVTIALAVVPWITTIKRLFRSGALNGGEIFGMILTVLLVVMPVILLVQLFSWWVYHFSLPYLWMRELGMGAALRRAWTATRANFGASVLFLLAFILAKIGATILGLVIVCVSCCAWIWPVGLIVLLAVATAHAPLAGIITVPLIVAAGFIVAWLISTVLAPIPVFFRAWSLAFVGGIDPTLVASAPAGPLPEPGPGPEVPGAAPPHEPPVPPVAPPYAPPEGEPSSYAPPRAEPPSYAPPGYDPPAPAEPPGPESPPPAPPKDPDVI